MRALTLMVSKVLNADISVSPAYSAFPAAGWAIRESFMASMASAVSRVMIVAPDVCRDS